MNTNPQEFCPDDTCCCICGKKLPEDPQPGSLAFDGYCSNECAEKGLDFWTTPATLGASKTGPMCQCGHFLGEHENGICYAMVGDIHGHVCECNHFQDEMDGPAALKQAREEHDDDKTRYGNDNRPIFERMRDGGVRWGELREAMFNDAGALVTTLNGLYFLDIGSVQPLMEEGDEVWDGSFELDNDVHKYVGASGPSGQGPMKSMVITDQTLIELF